MNGGTFGHIKEVMDKFILHNTSSQEARDETTQTSINSIIILSIKHSGRLIEVWVEFDLWLDSHNKPTSEYLKSLQIFIIIIITNHL